MTTEREMPKYQSHKQVHALQIELIVPDEEVAARESRETDGGAWIYPAEEGYAPFKVGAAYVNKHKPESGGYYVLYSDGYESWSPREAFEQGYTRIK